MSLFEPKRDAKIPHLSPDFRAKVEALLKAMWAKGYDAVCFETLRSQARQQWLYGYGRTHHKSCKPVTFTMQSNHLTGKAADIISKRKGWNWPAFFDALKTEAHKLGLHTLSFEGCHVESPDVS